MIFLQEQHSEAYQDDQIVFCAVKRGRLVNISFADFVRMTNTTVSYLYNQGIRKGNRVITSLAHGFDWNIIEQALFQLGAIHIPLAPDYGEMEIAEKMKLIDPQLLIANAPYHFKKLEKVNKENNYKLPLLLYPPHPPELQIQNANIETEINEQDIAVILFTSGSSEKSKAVPLSYGNIYTSILDFSGTDLFDGIESCLDILHHSFSGGRKVNYSAQLRGKKIMYANSTLSISDNIDFYKPDLVTCVPYLAIQILEQLKQTDSPSSIKKIICGGAELGSQVINEFAKYGIKVYNVYGLTETASLGTYNTEKSYRLGSAGKFSPKISYRINENQELLLKGDSVFKGYYTKSGIDEVMDQDGWFNTRDIVRVDEDGFLFLIGRSRGETKTQKGKFVN